MYQTPTITNQFQIPTQDSQMLEMAQKYNVSPSEVASYAKRLNTDPRSAAKEVAIDNLWKQTAQEHNILTGDKTEDDLKISQHWDFAHGSGGRDPLHDNPDAVMKFKDKSLAFAQNEGGF